MCTRKSLKTPSSSGISKILQVRSDHDKYIGSLRRHVHVHQEKSSVSVPEARANCKWIYKFCEAEKKELEETIGVAEARMEGFRNQDGIASGTDGDPAQDLENFRRTHESLVKDEEFLVQQLTLARSAQDWLDKPRRDVAPVGMSPDLWIDSCGGEEGSMIPPTRIISTKGVEPPGAGTSLKVSLFHNDTSTTVTKHEFRIRITEISAHDVRFSDFKGQPNLYCVCMPSNLGKSGFTTRIADDPMNPVWKCSESIKDYVSGDPLIFQLYDSQNGQDVLVAEAELPAKEFLPHGLHGRFRLFTGANDPLGWLKVRIHVSIN